MDGLSRDGRGSRGFTLIEIMIVIAIIVALGAVAALALFDQKKGADKDLARMELKTLRGAIDLFRLNFGRVPTEQEGVKVLWDKSALSSDADASKWVKYINESKPNDPWGSAWGYKSASSDDGYELWSYGPDKQDGTEDDIKSGGSGSTGSGGSGDVPPPSGSEPPPPPPSRP